VAQGAGDAHFYGPCLAGRPATVNADVHVHVATMVRGFEGVEHRGLVADDGEIAFQRPVINLNLTTASFDADTGYRGLAAAGAEGLTADFVFLRGDHVFLQMLRTEIGRRCPEG